MEGVQLLRAFNEIAFAERVRALQASGDRIEITLVDRTILRGRIIETANDSFTICEEKTNREVALQYGQVMEVKKWEGSGLSNSAKSGDSVGSCRSRAACFLCRSFSSRLSEAASVSSHGGSGLAPCCWLLR